MAADPFLTYGCNVLSAIQAHLCRLTFVNLWTPNLKSGKHMLEIDSFMHARS